jgi:hypothetical protein
MTPLTLEGLAALFIRVVASLVILYAAGTFLAVSVAQVEIGGGLNPVVILPAVIALAGLALWKFAKPIARFLCRDL